MIEAQEVAEGEGDPYAEMMDPYYEPYFCDEILRMADEMMFPEEWAAELGVSEPELFSWIGKFPEFARAYNVAATKLRAAFTREMRDSARGEKSFSQPALYKLFAEKRFPDLYGVPSPKALPPTEDPASINAPKTAMTGEVIDGTLVEHEQKPAEDMDAPELVAELEALRKRHTSG